MNIENINENKKKVARAELLKEVSEMATRLINADYEIYSIRFLINSQTHGVIDNGNYLIRMFNKQLEKFKPYLMQEVIAECKSELDSIKLEN